jgi:Dockerin type I domain
MRAPRLFAVRLLLVLGLSSLASVGAAIAQESSCNFSPGTLTFPPNGGTQILCVDAQGPHASCGTVQLEFVNPTGPFFPFSAGFVPVVGIDCNGLYEYWVEVGPAGFCGTVTAMYVTRDPVSGAVTGKVFITQTGNRNCPVECPVTVPTSFSQGDSAWAASPYDSLIAKGEQATIKGYGCTLLSLAMALEVACPEGADKDVPQIPCAAIDPLTLNAILNIYGDYAHSTDQKLDGNVLVPQAVKDVSNGGLLLDNLGGNGIQFGRSPAIDTTLCGTGGHPPHPVIVNVNSITHPDQMGHYVLITGIKGDTYTIIDPGCKEATDLKTPTNCSNGYTTQYNNFYRIVGAVADPPDGSELDLHIPGNAALQVTDPNGRSATFDPSTGQTQDAIPQSAYFLFELDNDEDASAPSIGPTHYVQIPQPNLGTYIVVVKGLAVGSIDLGVASFDANGHSLARFSQGGQAEVGSSATYLLSLPPGAPPTMVAVPGDRNGDGVVDCSDIGIVLAAMGTSAGEAGFDPLADVNADGRVDANDLSAFYGVIAPPTITKATATPNSLWPPNHKMTPVTINYDASDQCPIPVQCALTVTTNEPNGAQAEWQIIDGHNVLLRAERLGNDDGRTYTITATCTDPAGNASKQSVTVNVPHDQGQ